MRSGINYYILLAGLLMLFCSSCSQDQTESSEVIYGGITRFDKSIRDIYLVFTGHEFADGCKNINRTLEERNIKASFFFTGDFYRNPEFESCITSLIESGHYLGAHSDKHLLYVSWENRDSLLVTKSEFREDLIQNYNELERFGIEKEEAPFFLPPYEWYNSAISDWTAELGLILINFSSGTDSNQDWSYPEEGIKYFSSDTIFNRILRYEKTGQSGLSGFILLLHIGTDPRRPDKFYERLPLLLDSLTHRGYSFEKLSAEKI